MKYKFRNKSNKTLKFYKKKNSYIFIAPNVIVELDLSNKNDNNFYTENESVLEQIYFGAICADVSEVSDKPISL